MMFYLFLLFQVFELIIMPQKKSRKSPSSLKAELLKINREFLPKQIEEYFASWTNDVVHEEAEHPLFLDFFEKGEIIPIKRDGDCFFGALYHLFRSINHEDKDSILHQVLPEHLRYAFTYEFVKDVNMLPFINDQSFQPDESLTMAEKLEFFKAEFSMNSDYYPEESILSAISGGLELCILIITSGPLVRGKRVNSSYLNIVNGSEGGILMVAGKEQEKIAPAYRYGVCILQVDPIDKVKVHFNLVSFFICEKQQSLLDFSHDSSKFVRQLFNLNQFHDDRSAAERFPISDTSSSAPPAASEAVPSAELVHLLSHVKVRT
jgi:hypothetical protein